MKKLSLIIAILVTSTALQAETLLQTFTGKLRGTDTRDVHTLDLKEGNYNYSLKLTENKIFQKKVFLSYNHYQKDLQ